MADKKVGSSRLVKRLEKALAKPGKKDIETTKAFKKLQKDLAEDSMTPIYERNEEKTGDILTDGKCVVCGGRIVERRVQKYNPMSGPPIFGPGSARQFYVASAGYHCQECGLKYAFIPKKKE